MLDSTYHCSVYAQHLLALFCPANKDDQRDVAANEPIDHTGLAAINIDNDFIWFNANPMVAGHYGHPCRLLFTLAECFSVFLCW